MLASVCILQATSLNHVISDIFLFFAFLVLEREKEREERENTDLLFHFMSSLVSPCMCPDRELNLQSWHIVMTL